MQLSLSVFIMISYLTCTSGFTEQPKWTPNCWINVLCPTPHDIETLVADYGVPISILNDIEDSEERPRVELEDGWRMIIVRVPYMIPESENLFTTVPMGILMKGDIFVSICYYQVEMVTDFINFSRRKNLIEKNTFDLLLHLILSAFVWFMKYLKLINYETKEAEKQLQRSIRNEELLELMRLERTLVYFITSIRGNEVMFSKLKGMLRQNSISYDQELLEDLEIEMQQARIMANVHSDILSGMMDAFASIISNNMNVVMKRMTSASIILMVPTLIASFYGMNVPNGFESKPLAFAAITGVCVLISLVMVVIFYKRRWI